MHRHHGTQSRHLTHLFCLTKTQRLFCKLEGPFVVALPQSLPGQVQTPQCFVSVHTTPSVSLLAGQPLLMMVPAPTTLPRCWLGLVAGLANHTCKAALFVVWYSSLPHNDKGDDIYK